MNEMVLLYIFLFIYLTSSLNYNCNHSFSIFSIKFYYFFKNLLVSNLLIYFIFDFIKNKLFKF